MSNYFISLLLTLLLIFIAICKKALTIPAIILSGICSFIICLLGGLPCFIILTSTFILAEFASSFHKKDDIKKSINEKTGKRDFEQILLNVVPATLVLIIWSVTKNKIFLVIYASTCAEVLADTLGSDIGILSKKTPINIITLKKSFPGLSGNITLLGLFSELIGAGCIGIIYYFMINNNIIELTIIILSGFLGGLFDSFLGAIGQIKYKCTICQIITEKKVHCDKNTKYYCGIKWIDNDIVNLFSNIFSISLSLILCFLLR